MDEGHNYNDNPRFPSLVASFPSGFLSLGSDLPLVFLAMLLPYQIVHHAYQYNETPTPRRPAPRLVVYKPSPPSSPSTPLRSPPALPPGVVIAHTSLFTLTGAHQGIPRSLSKCRKWREVRKSDRKHAGACFRKPSVHLPEVK